MFQFCPYDGSRLVVQATAHDGVLPACPACDYVDYQNPKPCVAVLVEQDGRLLLGKRGIEPAKGMWDILGGFIHSGESAEEAVLRETVEETGLQVHIVKYLGSYGDEYGPRKIPTLNFCYVVRPIGGELRAASDVAEVRWFGPDDLPKEMAFAHQYPALKAWRESH